MILRGAAPCIVFPEYILIRNESMHIRFFFRSEIVPYYTTGGYGVNGVGHNHLSFKLQLVYQLNFSHCWF